MREIKFRAWAGNNFDTPMIYNVDIGCNGLVPSAFSSHDWPVMQYTGLKDKNGKEIYEGDICKTGGGRIGEIVYHKERCAFIFNDSFNELLYLALSFNNDIEIIGNIHKNPELLNK